MKRNLLLSSLLSLSILTFSGTAKAQESADATFTGTLSASTEVVKVQDGSATIREDGSTGDDFIPPLFRVTTSQTTGTDGRLITAEVSGVPTLAEQEGMPFIALTNGSPEGSAVSNALSNSPNAPDNPDVIAYRISVRAFGQPDFSFNSGALEGAILDSSGTNDVRIAFSVFPRSGTFDSNDSSGEYTASFTLTAVGNL